MSLTTEQIRSVLKEYREEFESNFPGEDPLKAASQFCNGVLSSKMEALLEKKFGFREPLDLIAILGHIHHEQAQKQPGERGPGRPRKPRAGDPEV